MRSLRDVSITAKLGLLILVASSVALLLATISFVWNDISLIRSSKIKQMNTVADLVGSNSDAALNFLDNENARKLLDSLRSQPEVEFARIYNSSNEIFATYHKVGSTKELPTSIPELETRFVHDGLNVVKPIIANGQKIGTIFLHANLNEIHEQLVRYVVIVAGMIIVSLVISTLIATRFQRLISTPILKLAETVLTISKDRNYGIRVKKWANDEIGILYDQFNTMLEQIQAGEAAIQLANDQLEMKIELRTTELSRANEELNHEIRVRSDAELELEQVHQRLVASARRAGMAEIATGVLHNVGNVLNSINVSATLVIDRIRQSKILDLTRATDLIKQNSENLATDMTSDAKGKHVPSYLILLSKHLNDERDYMMKEVDLLTTKIGHIKAIVATQQSYAGYSGVRETVDLGEVINDAINFNLASFERHHIAISKERPESIKVCIDKQKVLQILINIVKNAKEAFNDSPHIDNRKISLVVELNNVSKMIRISITDNAIGISKENLTRIFSHGFTTKNSGHGFGLHSCANAANEMGGSLSVQSEGLGKGATFVLEVPLDIPRNNLGDATGKHLPLPIPNSTIINPSMNQTL
jgi:two-component system, NtrC family, sensor kinase